MHHLRVWELTLSVLSCRIAFASSVLSNKLFCPLDYWVLRSCTIADEQLAISGRAIMSKTAHYEPDAEKEVRKPHVLMPSHPKKADKPVKC